jgi:hypothetical protein
MPQDHARRCERDLPSPGHADEQQVAARLEAGCVRLGFTMPSLADEVRLTPEADAPPWHHLGS